VFIVKSPYVDVIASSKFANSYPSLQRVFAYIYKFCNGIRHPGLTVAHIQEGTHMMPRLVQRAQLWEDLQSLKRWEEFPRLVPYPRSRRSWISLDFLE